MPSDLPAPRRSSSLAGPPFMPPSSKRARRVGQVAAPERSRFPRTQNGVGQFPVCGCVHCRPGLLLAERAPVPDAEEEAQAYESERETDHPTSGRVSTPSSIGAGCISTFSPLPGRGGPRNRADRVTTALSKAALTELAAATDFARQTGLAFNRHTTIHWDAAGVSDPLRATRRFLKLLGDAVRAAGGSFAYVWVRENGYGKGEHVHILWHGPADLPVFKRRVKSWLKLCGGAPRRGVCLTRSIARWLGEARTGSEYYQANLWWVLDYLAKGGNADARKTLAVQHNEPGGPIVGKRCGTSAKIGRKARGA